MWRQTDKQIKSTERMLRKWTQHQGSGPTTFLSLQKGQEAGAQLLTLSHRQYQICSQKAGVLEQALRLKSCENLTGLNFCICNLKGSKADLQIPSQICVLRVSTRVSEAVLRAQTWEELALPCSYGKSEKSFSLRSFSGRIHNGL